MFLNVNLQGEELNEKGDEKGEKREEKNTKGTKYRGMVGKKRELQKR